MCNLCICIIYFIRLIFINKYIKVYFLNKVFLKIEFFFIIRNIYIVYVSEKLNYKVIM